MSELYEHQRKLIEQNPSKIGIFFDCGAGKTLTAIRLAEKNVSNCLIICPKGLKDNWLDEIKKFSNGKVNFAIYSKEEFKKYLLIIPKYDACILDEIHHASSPKSQLHKAVLWYLEMYNVKYVYGLTATPLMASCWSVYGIGKILGHNWSWYQWKKRFFNDIKMGRRYVPVQKKNIEKEIGTIINNIGVTAKLDDLFDVPEQIFLKEYFELTNEQKKAIENLVEPTSIVRWTYTHCIENGIKNSDGYDEIKVFDCEKTKRVVELCQEHKKIAVVARYNLQLEHYYNILSKNHTVFIINGKTDNKIDIVNKINELNECVVLLQGACSEGFNLWSVPVMVFASYDFSYKNYYQMQRIILRANHLKKNVYISLIVKRGVDEDVYKSVVINKTDFYNKIFDKNL